MFTYVKLVRFALNVYRCKRVEFNIYFLMNFSNDIIFRIFKFILAFQFYQTIFVY